MLRTSLLLLLLASALLLPVSLSAQEIVDSDGCVIMAVFNANWRKYTEFTRDSADWNVRRYFAVSDEIGAAKAEVSRLSAIMETARRKRLAIRSGEDNLPGGQTELEKSYAASAQTQMQIDELNAQIADAGKRQAEAENMARQRVLVMLGRDCGKPREKSPLQVTIVAPAKATLGDTVILQAKVSGGSGNYRYVWTTKSADGEGSSGSGASRIGFRASAPGSHPILLTVYDKTNDAPDGRATLLIEITNPPPDVANCSAIAHSEPYMNDIGLSECRCVKGYIWDAGKKNCIVDKAAQVAAAKCSLPNMEPYWRDDVGKPWCRCVKGYVWDAASQVCVIDKAAQIAAAKCPLPNMVVGWRDDLGKPWCFCVQGYVWDEDRKACSIDTEAQVAQADCSGTPNSRPYWDRSANAARCMYCLAGTHWKDGAALECVADDNGGGGGQEGGPNFEGLINAIGNANRKYQEDTNRINNDYNRGRRELDNQPPAPPQSFGHGNPGSDVDPQAADKERQKRQKQIDSLRIRIGDMEKSLQCLEEGKRKFPKSWLDCNGNWTLGSRDVAIDQLRRGISDNRTQLNNLQSGGPLR